MLCAVCNSTCSFSLFIFFVKIIIACFINESAHLRSVLHLFAGGFLCAGLHWIRREKSFKGFSVAMDWADFRTRKSHSVESRRNFCAFLNNVMVKKNITSGELFFSLVSVGQDAIETLYFWFKWKKRIKKLKKQTSLVVIHYPAVSCFQKGCEAF